MTKPNLERRAARHVRRLGFETYIPIYKNHQSKTRLLFPRYLFVSFADCFAKIYRSDGLYSVLGTDDGPARIGEAEVDRWRAEEEEMLRGPCDRFKLGQRLRVVRGQFSEMLASYAGLSSRRRECAFVDLLGRPVRVEFKLGQLTAA